MAALGSAQTGQSFAAESGGEGQVARWPTENDNVDYSSRRAEGAPKIFGGLVPYGKCGARGANEATTFVTTKDLMVAVATCRRQLHHFAIPNKQVDTHHQQEDGRWGYRLPGPLGRSGANRHEGVGACLGVGTSLSAFDKTASAARCGWIGRRHGHPWKFRGCSIVWKSFSYQFYVQSDHDSEEAYCLFPANACGLRSKAAEGIQNEKRRAG